MNYQLHSSLNLVSRQPKSLTFLFSEGRINLRPVPAQKVNKFPENTKPTCILDHYIFIISQLWLTFHPRSTVVLLDTGTPGTSREIFSEDADGETRTRNPLVINRVL